MSERLELRVIGAPWIASQAVAQLGQVLELDHHSGPYPSRKTPGLVLFYLTGRLRPTNTPPPQRRAVR